MNISLNVQGVIYINKSEVKKLIENRISKVLQIIKDCDYCYITVEQQNEVIEIEKRGYNWEIRRDTLNFVGIEYNKCLRIIKEVFNKID